MSLFQILIAVCYFNLISVALTIPSYRSNTALLSLYHKLKPDLNYFPSNYLQLIQQHRYEAIKCFIFTFTNQYLSSAIFLTLNLKLISATSSYTLTLPFITLNSFSLIFILSLLTMPIIQKLKPYLSFLIRYLSNLTLQSLKPLLPYRH